jgi:fatty-acyl-CoA synthase
VRAPTDGGLLLRSVWERAEAVFPNRGLVTGTDTGAHRQTYAELAVRVRTLCGVLLSLGIRPGDRVASFAWNTHRHLELFFAVPAVGAVLQALNARLRPHETQRLVREARPRALFVDASLLEAAPALEQGGVLVVLPDAPHGRADALDYEELLRTSAPPDRLPAVDEDAVATMCTTSATTGEPQLVQYTHRSLVLGTLVLNQPDGLGAREGDTIMPVVSLFHANAWGFPFAAALSGARLVLCGAKPSPREIARLIAEERVTKIGAVPTVFVHLLKEPGLDLSSVEEVFCAGAAPPRSLAEALASRGVEVVHAWGMTETGFFGLVSRPPPDAGLTEAEMAELRLCQGRPVPLLAHRLAAGDGELQVRGPAVAGVYADPALAAARRTADGWVRTSDLAVEARHGFVRVVDRMQDAIKSGGEWIHTLELEERLASFDGVEEAAVVPIGDERWGQRPVAFLVVRDASSFDRLELERFLAESVPSWWIPERVELVDDLPRTSTGKVHKRALRDRLVPSAARGASTRS